MVMELPIYQIDAFTDRLFAGNPAAVCPLPHWLKDATLQAIAAENNLSETAFFLAEGEGFRLRWFTPTLETDLCGHATLATAFVISNFLEPGRAEMHFETRSGRLTATRESNSYVLDFPLRLPRPNDNPAVGRAMGKAPQELYLAVPFLAVYETAEDVAGLRPDLDAVAALPGDGVLATAPGRDGVDYVARYFAPAAGIPEDPATGSSHSVLMPYWSKRLGRQRLVGRQISARGGDFRCELAGNRVRIAGKAACYLKGSIFVDD
jgi:predicted PhzF superfamily epimerase YddE/YHI9